ncbi:hypothetical protein [Streptomyces bluensis]|uniref:hypothetical protein n=1 Tax=Streptomyces bluensis TaxID=33897 RepID=UPI003318FECF
MSSEHFRTPLSRRSLLRAGAASVAVAGVGSLAAACSSGSSSNSSDSKTLKVAVFTDQTQADKMQKAASTFEAAHAGMKVKFIGTTGTDWNDFFSKLLTQIRHACVHRAL